MSFEKVPAGKNPPHEINVIIEIPAQEGPVKYEVDKDTDMIKVDRIMSTSMRYPCNYGYMPKTLAEDGDPTDVLVVTPFPLLPGSYISVRPIGMLEMTDESGVDYKVLAVPVDKLSKIYSQVQAPADVGSVLLATIVHFFETYKLLEPGKWVKIGNWLNAEAAKREIIKSLARYQESL